MAASARQAETSLPVERGELSTESPDGTRNLDNQEKEEEAQVQRQCLITPPRPQEIPEIQEITQISRPAITDLEVQLQWQEAPNSSSHSYSSVTHTCYS